MSERAHEPTKLGALILQRIDKLGISQAEVARRSGGLVSQALVSAIIVGRHRGKWMSEDTVKGLAYALDVDEDRIWRLVEIRVGDPYIPTPESRNLTVAQRDAIDALIRSII
ncbi:MAG: helix-turn-helix transcriptional regulator [Mycobacterium sp.]